MANFEHFIITRFNLRNENWKSDKNNNTVLSEEWLAYRYDLFQKTCYNSLKKQSNLNFKWFVYFDVDTPLVFKALNEKMAKDFPQFIPKYRGSNAEFVNQLTSDIDNEINGKEYVITTRIDNDDAFHFETVETIQKNVNTQKNKYIINLSWITCFNIEKKEFSKYYFTSNPFISLVEQNSQDKDRDTIFSRNHNLWRKDTAFVNVDKGSYCLQIIHDTNVLNEMQGELIVNKNIKQDFNILLDTNYNSLYLIKKNIYNTFTRFNKKIKKTQTRWRRRFQ